MKVARTGTLRLIVMISAPKVFVRPRFVLFEERNTFYNFQNQVLLGSQMAQACSTRHSTRKTISYEHKPRSHFSHINRERLLGISFMYFAKKTFKMLNFTSEKKPYWIGTLFLDFAISLSLRLFKSGAERD